MYKIGLSTGAFDMTEENFEKAAAGGIESVEISRSLLSQHDTINYKELAEFSKRYHIDLWSYHLPFGPFEEIDISSADSTIRTKTMDSLTQLIQKAANIGIQRFVVHPSTEPIADSERDLRMGYAMESLDKLAEFAHKNNAIIAVEDLPRTCLGNTTAEILKLISANDKLQVCFDTNHLLKESNPEFIEKVAGKIATVHISDYDFVDEKHWLPGEGINDWHAIYSTLQKVGYSGVWMYELLLDSPRMLTRSRDLMFSDLVRNAHEIFENAPITRIL